MGIFDRYLLRTFARVLVICFVSLAGLYVVIDLFNNLDEFISYGERLGGMQRVMVDYYGARVFTFFDRTSSVLALIASLFVISWMQRTNELTAVEAAGVSRLRIVKPLFLATVVISMLGIANREWLIPQYRDALSRNAQDWLGEKAHTLVPRFDNETDIYFNGRSTIARERKIIEPIFRLPGELAAFGRQLHAATAVYQPENAEHPAGYLLQGVTSPSDIDRLPTGRIGDREVIFTPAESPWLKSGECFVASRVDFDQLTAGDAWRRYSSSRELIRALHNPSLDYGADVRVTVHARMVQPLLDVLLFLLGLPLIFSQRNRNVFVASGMCIGVVAIYFLIIMASQALGANYLLSPAFAAWLPVIVLSPAAYYFAAPLWQ